MHVAVSIVLVLACGLAAAQPPPGTGEATLANLRKAENFWSSPQWLDTSLPNKERFGSYFHPKGEWCLGKVCGKGYDGLAEVADGFADMLSHLRVVVTEPFLSDAKYHAGGRWVDTLVCKARGDLVFQLTGAVFIEVDPETGLIMRESDIIDYDMLASAAAACTGLPGAMFKPPGSVNKELLDATIREQDEVWQALMSRNRIPDDQIASFVKASAAPGAEVCFNTDAGCMELGGPAFVEQLKQWRSVVSDMQLEYSSERRYAPGAVGVRWVGHYGCVNGGTPMANSGYLLYHIDDSGKILRVINAFYEIGVVRQIGECLSQDSGAHPEL